MEILTDKALDTNKDDFYKYQSIDNHYNVKFLNKIPQDIKDGLWVSSEKLDGANLSIYFAPGQEFKLGKRSGWINKDENFFDCWTVVQKYMDILIFFSRYAEETGSTVRFYAELYGAGVQKRINYGPEKYIKVFDVVINGKYLSPKEFGKFYLDNLEVYDADKEVYSNFFSSYEIHIGIANALAVDVEKDNYEGIVIKPYKDTVWLYGTDRLILKKKSIKFSDIAEDKIGGKLKNFNPEHIALSEDFKRYITENRMLDLFSKHGEINDIKQMGTYIKLFLEDAKEDYLKTHSIEGLDQDTVKAVFNIGSVAANMLRNHMNSTVKI